MKGLFDRYAKKYDAWYEKYKYAYLSELEAVRQVLPRKGKGLEIGVGTGRFAGPLGIKWGIDPSSAMLRIAASRGIRTQRAEGEALPFADAAFDYAAIIITLCFVKNPFAVLKEAKRVLKKNGRLVIGVIPANSFLAKAYKKKKSIFYEHARFFDIKYIRCLLRKTGFKKLVFYQTLFSLPEYVFRVEKPHRGFDKGGFITISAVH